MTVMENQIILSPDDLIKHWLLNLAAEVPAPLVLIFPEVACEALNVRNIPGRGPEDYAKALIVLFNSGMIQFSSETPADDVKTEAGISRVLDRFLEFSKDDSLPLSVGPPPYGRSRLPGMQVSFELTSRGGNAWEKVAQPNWTHIFTESSDSMSGELTSPNRDLLMAYMGWYPKLHEQQITLESIRWQTHPDFKVLYWKPLPLVYQVSFSLKPGEARWISSPKWFQDWWLSVVSWYKKPWELAGWPSE